MQEMFTNYSPSVYDANGPQLITRVFNALTGESELRSSFVGDSLNVPNQFLAQKTTIKIKSVHPVIYFQIKKT